MNINKFTQKSLEAVKAAEKLADLVDRYILGDSKGQNQIPGIAAVLIFCGVPCVHWNLDLSTAVRTLVDLVQMPVVGPDDFEIDLLMFLIPSGIYEISATYAALFLIFFQLMCCGIGSLFWIKSRHL